MSLHHNGIHDNGIAVPSLVFSAAEIEAGLVLIDALVRQFRMFEYQHAIVLEWKFVDEEKTVPLSFAKRAARWKHRMEMEAMHVAASQIAEAILKRDVSRVGHLLRDFKNQNNNSVPKHDYRGLAPLHYECSDLIKEDGVSAAMVSTLIQGNCDPNAKTPNGLRPIHLAAFASKGSVISQLLKDSRVNPNDLTQAGDSSLHLAVAAATTTTTTTTMNNNGDSPDGLVNILSNPVSEVVRMLLTCRANPKIVNREGCLPIELARECGNDVAIRLLSAAMDSMALFVPKASTTTGWVGLQTTVEDILFKAIVNPKVENAALLIQAKFKTLPLTIRWVRQQKMKRQVRAASSIQAVWKGHQIRKGWKRLQIESMQKQERRKQESARKIQECILIVDRRIRRSRGNWCTWYNVLGRAVACFLARKKLARLRAPAPSNYAKRIQNAWRCHTARSAFNQERRVKIHHCAISIQSAFRAHWARYALGVAQLTQFSQGGSFHGHTNLCWWPFRPFPITPKHKGNKQQQQQLSSLFVLRNYFVKGQMTQSFSFVDDIISSLQVQSKTTGKDCGQQDDEKKGTTSDEINDTYCLQLIGLCNEYALQQLDSDQVHLASEMLARAHRACAALSDYGKGSNHARVHTKKLVMWTLDNLALLRTVLGNYAEAMAYSEEASSWYGREDVVTELGARVLHRLHQAIILSHSREHLRALKRASAALGLIEKVTGQDEDFCSVNEQGEVRKTYKEVLAYCYHVLSLEQFHLGEAEAAIRSSKTAAGLVLPSVPSQPRIYWGQQLTDDFLEKFHMDCSLYCYHQFKQIPAHRKVKRRSQIGPILTHQPLERPGTALINRVNALAKGDVNVPTSLHIPQCSNRDLLLPRLPRPVPQYFQKSAKRRRRRSSPTHSSPAHGHEEFFDDSMVKSYTKNNLPQSPVVVEQHHLMECWLEFAPVADIEELKCGIAPDVVAVRELRLAKKFKDALELVSQILPKLITRSNHLPVTSPSLATQTLHLNDKDAGQLALQCIRCGLACLPKNRSSKLALQFFHRAETITSLFTLPFEHKPELRCWSLDNLACLQLMAGMPHVAREHLLAALDAIDEDTSSPASQQAHRRLICLLHLTSVLSALNRHDQVLTRTLEVSTILRKHEVFLKKMLGEQAMLTIGTFCFHMTAFAHLQKNRYSEASFAFNRATNMLKSSSSQNIHSFLKCHQRLSQIIANQ